MDLHALNAVVAGTSIQACEHHDELDSTNDRGLARPADSPRPALIVAERQTAGRGRGGNAWWSAAGALTFSVVDHRMPLPPERRPLIALATGLAVRRAVVETWPRLDVRLKWPNDLLLDGRKICGILVEETEDRLVIGIGLNVSNSFASAPEPIRLIGTSLVEAIGGEAIDRGALLRTILLALDDERARLLDGERIDQRWSAACALQQSFVSVRRPDRVVEGVCDGIDELGALIVRTANGRERLLSGVVERFG